MMMTVGTYLHEADDLKPPYPSRSCGAEGDQSSFPLSLRQDVRPREFSFPQPSIRSDPSYYSLSSSSTNSTICSSPQQMSQQHPSATERQGKPTLTLQPPSEKDRKTKYVDALVDTTAGVISSIWHSQLGPKKTKLVTLRVFIQEVLRRSRTTYSTLQTALFYLFRVKNLILARQNEASKAGDNDVSITTFCVTTADSTTIQCNEDDLINCGRRMFLASLMIASKYLQDKNYRNKAWAKIAGLSVLEINATEIAFLKLIDYNLFISKTTFERWYTLLHGHVNAQCAEPGSFREEANISRAGDMLFTMSTDAYESPLPSPTSPNPPRLPSPPAPASFTSSKGTMLTPDSGLLSPVEGTLIAPRTQQHYQSPSPSPPPPLRKTTTTRSMTGPSLRRQATTAAAAALLPSSIAPTNIRSLSIPVTVLQFSSSTENESVVKRRYEDAPSELENAKKAKLEDDGYISDEGTLLI